MKIDRNEFLTRGKTRKTADVEIPDMGTVAVRELSAAEVSQYVKRHQDGQDDVDSLAWLVTTSAIDDAGKPLFRPEDAAELRDMPLHVLKPIADAVAKLAGLDGDAKKN
jgi:hypothetical protein